MFGDLGLGLGSRDFGSNVQGLDSRDLEFRA